MKGTVMEPKKYAYAVIGAPVVIARHTQEKIDGLRTKATETATSLSKDARTRVDLWSKEGEKLVGKVSDSKKIDELAAKVDLGPAKDQVNKLRDQLEGLLSTWKANFRPEGVTKEKVVIETPKPAAKKPAAKKPAAKKPAAKKPAAKKPAAKTGAKKPAPKAPAAKTEVKAS